MLLSLLSLLAPDAGAAQYQLAPPPRWVEIMPPGAAAAATVDGQAGGADFLLVDRQIRIDDGSAEYLHFVVRLDNQSGVEDQSQITINFDPQKDRLQLHDVTLRRGEERFDALRSGRIQVLQRESSLEQGLLDGSLTFHLLMNDVRVGDTLDYSYTIEHRDPEWGNRFFGRRPTRWGTRVHDSRLRVLHRAGTPLRVQSSDSAEPSVRTEAGWEVQEWRWQDLAPLLGEAERPAWYDQYPAIEFSQFRTWAEVVQAAEPMFQVPPKPTAALATLAAQWRAAPGSDADRALAVVRFVQENIRYTGIELGDGAFRPAAPDEVLKRRFGDCKDKTLLAVTMLRGLGIEASPALVSTRWRGQLAARLPSPGVMNHAIVRARIDGQEYWFDVTQTGQGGTLADFAQADFGAALVIAPGVAEVTPMPRREYDEPQITATSTVDFRQGLDREAVLEVATVYRGLEADRMRRHLRSTTVQELGSQYLNYYKGLFDGVRSAAAPQVRDDLTKNEVAVKEAYRIEHAIETDAEGDRTFEVSADLIAERLKAPETKVRTTPLALPFPTHIVERIRLLLPVKPDVDDDAVKVDAPGFAFSSSVARVGNDIALEYRYRTLSDHVAVAELAEHLKKREQARQDAFYSLPFGGRSSRHQPQRSASMLGVAAAGLALGAVLAVALWRRDLLGSDRSEGIDGPSGVRGWLLLPALHTFLMPVLAGYELYAWSPFFASSFVRSLSGWHLPAVAALIGLTALRFGPALALVALLWHRRVSFPDVYVLLIWSFGLLGLLAFAILNTLPNADAEAVAELGRTMFQVNFSALIWTWYMLRSRRVRATFTNRAGADDGAVAAAAATGH